MIKNQGPRLDVSIYYIYYVCIIDMFRREDEKGRSSSQSKVARA